MEIGSSKNVPFQDQQWAIHAWALVVIIISTTAVASSRILCHPSLSLPSVLQFLTPSFLMSLFSTPVHLILGYYYSSSFWPIIHSSFWLFTIMCSDHVPCPPKYLCVWKQAGDKPFLYGFWYSSEVMLPEDGKGVLFVAKACCLPLQLLHNPPVPDCHPEGGGNVFLRKIETDQLHGMKTPKKWP